MKKILDVSINKIYIILVILISLFMLGGYFSYAMFTVTKEKSNAISIVTGNLTYKLEVDSVEGNTLTVPANTTKEFTVTLSNPNNRIARFNFYYLGELPSKIEAGYVEEDGINIPPPSTGINLEKAETSGSSNTYKIKVTNANDSEVTINLGVEVGLDYNDLTLPNNGHLFEKYNEIINDPKIDNGMIPVKYENNNWVKADKSNANNDWYNYSEQKWANVVTVSSTTRDNYLNAEVGTTINMNDIETMWVWIPRYSYSIGTYDGTNYYGKQGDFLSSMPTKDLPGEIDIKFIDTTVKDRGKGNYDILEGWDHTMWYTPDAFTFGEEELSGIWVGKFETSSSNPSATDGGGNTTNLDAMIKPNVTSWRNINLSNAFNVSLKMNDEGNRYGFTSNVDTHMIKNSEWATVAYLSQSKYGKLGNANFTGANKEVYQNRSDQYLTGCSAGIPAPTNILSPLGCQYTYDIEINGTGASTTGNIYGIYDTSGGAYEQVMANYNDIIGSSGFSTMPESKYYDKYTNTDATKACNNNICISHSLTETNGWYKDNSTFLTSSNPWLLRSANYGDTEGSGIFLYGYFTSVVNYSFRLVVT